MSRSPLNPATHVVIWQTRAIADLDAVHDFIAGEAPGPAVRIRDALRAAAQALEFFPHRGRALGRAYVISVMERYLLRYRIRGTQVVILGIRDGRRR